LLVSGRAEGRGVVNTRDDVRVAPVTLLRLSAVMRKDVAGLSGCVNFTYRTATGSCADGLGAIRLDVSRVAAGGGRVVAPGRLPVGREG
jgi:hypothetical protein